MESTQLICNFCKHPAHCGHSCTDESCDHCPDCGCDNCQTDTYDEVGYDNGTYNRGYN